MPLAGGRDVGIPAQALVLADHCSHQITTLPNLLASRPAGIGQFWLPLKARSRPRSTNMLALTVAASVTSAPGTR